MDRLDEVRAFIAVAEARSFTQGARKLGVSSAQASKLVARLENRLGARLMNRTTRDVSLTDVGRAYLDRGFALNFTLYDKATDEKAREDFIKTGKVQEECWPGTQGRAPVAASS